jgi:hypothetical protein
MFENFIGKEILALSPLKAGAGAISFLTIELYEYPVSRLNSKARLAFSRFRFFSDTSLFFIATSRSARF